MPTVSLSAIRDKIKVECDLEEEVFISDSTINNFINDSIRDIEAQIHSIYEDYFLSNANIALVNGTSAYDLPTDIYADKIRAILYSNGSTKYTICRLRDLKVIPLIDPNMNYVYQIVNTAASGRKLTLYPASNETSATNVTIWYIRNAKELTSDAHICDIPEFINYVYARTKLYIFEFEGSPMVVESAQEVERLKNEMIATLSNRIPDDDNKILIDESFYNDVE